MAAAVELAPMNIRVNNVHPSLVKTPLLDDCWTPDQAKHIQSTIGLGRAAEPVEVANGTLTTCQTCQCQMLTWMTLQSLSSWPRTRAASWRLLQWGCMGLTLRLDDLPGEFNCALY